MNQRVAILAPTHQAINTALTTIHRLFPDRDVIKVGDSSKTDSLDPDIPLVNRENKTSIPVEGRVTGMTYATAIFQLMLRINNTVPNVLIVDEAGQLPLAQGSFCGLSGAGKIVLFGDDKQMPPVFPGDLSSHRLATSVFAQLRTEQPQVIIPLRFTYRLNPQLAQAVGSSFYPELKGDGLVSCQIESSRYLIQASQNESSLEWYQIPIRNARQINEPEARMSADIVSGFLKDGLPADQIAVVTPFRRQVARIRTLLAAQGLYNEGKPIVDTVERVQGMTVEVIVVSMCASDPDYVAKTAEFVYSLNRMNVAISRARNKAFILSAPDIFSHLPSTHKGIIAREACRKMLIEHARTTVYS